MENTVNSGDGSTTLPELKSGWSATEMYTSGSVAASAVQLALHAAHPAVQTAGIVVAGAVACWYGWLRTSAKKHKITADVQSAGGAS